MSVTIDFQTVRDANPLHEVAARYLPQLKRKGRNYIGCCPFHEDKHPSFSIFRGKDDVYRYRCFACGEYGDVIDFIASYEGCDKIEAVKILTNGELPEVGTHIPRPLPPDETKAWEPIVPAPDYAPKYHPQYTFNPNRGETVDWARIAERWDAYLDAEENILFYVVRLNMGDTKICPVVSYCEGPEGRKCWAAKRPQPPHPLMGLNLLAKHPTRHVLIVSGEKCYAAHNEHTDKIIGVTWLGGDDNVLKTDWSPLHGRENTYWADADRPGVLAMRKMFKDIEKSGTG